MEHSEQVEYSGHAEPAAHTERVIAVKHGSHMPDGYIPRINDVHISELLDTFAAIEIFGTMWCGKTWSSLAFGESVSHVGRPNVRRTVEADPSLVLVGAHPHVIDEWQDVPEIWDVVRDAVDADPAARGSYILTGSSSLNKDQVGHSGAGRIGRIQMRTMSLAETGESSAKISLSDLFSGNFEPCLVQQSLAPLADIVCRGGWPALRSATLQQVSNYLDSYLNAICDVNMTKRGFTAEDAQRTLRALARNVASQATLKTLASDAFGDASHGATRHISSLISALKSLYVIEGIPGWDAPIRSKSRLRSKPKYYFADVALPAYLLGIAPERLLQDGQLFGALFESLCMHDLAVYAATLKGAPSQPLRYYRDSDGLEVDAIIELADGRWAAFEIKLGDNKVDEAFANLARLRKKIALNPAARNPEPTFMAVIVGAGEYARFDKEADAYVIPISALGA